VGVAVAAAALAVAAASAAVEEAVVASAAVAEVDEEVASVDAVVLASPGVAVDSAVDADADSNPTTLVYASVSRFACPRRFVVQTLVEIVNSLMVVYIVDS